MAVLIADLREIRSPATPEAALVLLPVMTAAVMLALAMLKLGSLVRFLTNAVLIGLVTAVAVTIVVGQLEGITGCTSDVSNRPGRAIDTVIHVAAVDRPPFLMGLATIGLVLVLENIPLGTLGLFAAVDIFSAIAVVIPLGPVGLLRDITEISQCVPLPMNPGL